MTNTFNESKELTLTNEQIVNLICKLKHAIYLKSLNGRNGWSIISGNPSRISVNPNEVNLNKEGYCDTVTGQSFTSGWIGVNGYDKKFFFAAYYDWSYSFCHESNEGWLYFSETCSKETRNAVNKLIESSSSNSDLNQNLTTRALDWKPSQSFSQYNSSFARLKEYIFAGDCYQANLTQRFEANANWSKGDAINAFLNDTDRSMANYCAFIEIEANNFLLSLSPEQFLQCHEGTLQSKPIKGTVKANGALTTKQEQELLSTKNKAENLMIVDLLRNDLGKVSETGSVTVEKLFDIESFSNVHHLVSTIKSKLNRARYDEFSAFLNCFPGGSITGAPKIRAMEIIKEIEKHPRRYYCGSIFYWDDRTNNFDSNILIRTVELINNKAYCWAGGGIVADSELMSEYQESINKVRHITGINP